LRQDKNAREEGLLVASQEDRLQNPSHRFSRRPVRGVGGGGATPSPASEADALADFNRPWVKARPHQVATLSAGRKHCVPAKVNRTVNDTQTWWVECPFHRRNWIWR
jgi:hypothetical protein